jgi:hypothetical protein
LVKQLAVTQAPLVHTSPLAQALPQAPQLLVLELVSTQPAAQAVVPAGQTQVPAEQV